MNPKRKLNLSGILFMSLTFLFITSCGKNNDIPNDPPDTVTLNMLNEDNGKTVLGISDVYINKSNNFRTYSSLLSDAGNASGIGVKIEPQTGNLTQEVAVTPGHIYQVFSKRTVYDFPSGNRAVQIGAGYYHVYVVSPIAKMENSIPSGAVVKYVLAYPDTKGLPEADFRLGVLYNAGDKVEIALPQDAECFFEKHHGSGETEAFDVSAGNGKLTITLNKYPNNVSGPYGTYRTYIRRGNVFTTVIVNVGVE